MRARIAHEDARRVEVEQQKTGAAAGERAAQLHDRELPLLTRGEEQDQGEEEYVD